MELRHLRYFVAVAEHENVSRAALKLRVSQPGLSRQIRDLEEELGFPLFQRSAKSLRLTPAGRTFLREARAVLRRAEEAVERARAAADGQRGQIQVGYAPSLTLQILPRALREFQSRFPKARVALHDLSTEAMISQLQNGTLDVALMVQPGAKAARGLDHRALARYPIQVAVATGHPLAKFGAVTLAQLTGERLIAFSRKEYPEYHAMLARLFAPKRPPGIAEEHDGVTGIAAAVESGGGVALVPGCVASMVGGRLKMIPLAERAPNVHVAAVWRKGAQSNELVKEFLSALTEN